MHIAHARERWKKPCSVLPSHSLPSHSGLERLVFFFLSFTRQPSPTPSTSTNVAGNARDIQLMPIPSPPPPRRRTKPLAANNRQAVSQPIVPKLQALAITRQDVDMIAIIQNVARGSRPSSQNSATSGSNVRASSNDAYFHSHFSPMSASRLDDLFLAQSFKQPPWGISKCVHRLSSGSGLTSLLICNNPRRFDSSNPAPPPPPTASGAAARSRQVSRGTSSMIDGHFRFDLSDFLVHLASSAITQPCMPVTQTLKQASLTCSASTHHSHRHEQYFSKHFGPYNEHLTRNKLGLLSVR